MLTSVVAIQVALEFPTLQGIPPENSTKMIQNAAHEYTTVTKGNTTAVLNYGTFFVAYSPKRNNGHSAKLLIFPRFQRYRKDVSNYRG